MNALSRIFRRTPSLRARVVVATAIGAAIPVLIVGTVVWVGITEGMSIRAAAGMLILSGPVKEDAMLAGRDIQLEPGAQVGRDVFLAARTAELQAPVGVQDTIPIPMSQILVHHWHLDVPVHTA